MLISLILSFIALPAAILCIFHAGDEDGFSLMKSPAEVAGMAGNWAQLGGSVALVFAPMLTQDSQLVACAVFCFGGALRKFYAHLKGVR